MTDQYVWGLHTLLAISTYVMLESEQVFDKEILIAVVTCNGVAKAEGLNKYTKLEK